MDSVVDNLKTVEAELRMAVAAARRPAGSARLIAVSKMIGGAGILSALDAGHRDFGENRVQEAQAKWPALRQRFPDIRLHLIGPLQSNKARDAVALFDVIHTLDRERIAAAIAEESARLGRHVQLLAQVNIGKEPQKAGAAPEEAVAFVRRCRQTYGLTIDGLMCIPPAEFPPAPYFALTAKLGREAGVGELSMGMSADFRTAVAFGATMVRVGTAIFGERLSGAVPGAAPGTALGA